MKEENNLKNYLNDLFLAYKQGKGKAENKIAFYFEKEQKIVK